MLHGLRSTRDAACSVQGVTGKPDENFIHV